MRGRNYLALGLIGLLAAANVLYWGAREAQSRTASAPPAVSPGDLRIAALAPASPARAMRRDLFAARGAAHRPDPVARPAPAPAPVAPAPTPQQLDEKAAQAELAQFKCVGVVFRRHQGQAFLLLGDRAYVATPGATVGGRFRVSGITLDGVSLQDLETDVSGQLPVSGN